MAYAARRDKTAVGGAGGLFSSRPRESGGGGEQRREKSDDDDDGSKSFIPVENGVAGSLSLKAADRRRGRVPRSSGAWSWKRAKASTRRRRRAGEGPGQARRGGGTHMGFDRRPRLPFLPMTGVPKCSGLVSGSLSSVCTGKTSRTQGSECFFLEAAGCKASKLSRVFQGGKITV